MSDLPRRGTIRLADFDYSTPLWYYITICIQDRACILGKVVGDRSFLSPVGHVAHWQWLKLRAYFPHIELDEYVIMPNHIHGIIRIRATVKIAPTLGQIIGSYKSRVIHECLSLFNNQNRHLGKLWQRNYYEHIIRDDTDRERIRRYIRHNPVNWTRDKLFP